MSLTATPGTTTTGSIILKTAFRNYSLAERAGVVVFGLLLPLVMIPLGVFLLVTLGPHNTSLSYILPILGIVMVFVILPDHATQTVSLRAVGIEPNRLSKQQRGA